MNAVRPLTPEERQRGRRAALKLAADELERLVAEIPPRPADWQQGEDYSDWRARHNGWRDRYERVAAHMREAHGARITDTGQASRMTLRGVTCSCTGGLTGLFPAWVQKARVEVERLA